MPNQILAAVNLAGKRMPMCSYPEQMHEFQSFGDAVVACRHCGAQLRPLPEGISEKGYPGETALLSDGAVVRYWDERGPKEAE